MAARRWLGPRSFLFHGLRRTIRHQRERSPPMCFFFPPTARNQMAAISSCNMTCWQGASSAYGCSEAKNKNISSCLAPSWVQGKFILTAQLPGRVLFIYLFFQSYKECQFLTAFLTVCQLYFLDNFILDDHVQGCPYITFSLLIRYQFFSLEYPALPLPASSSFTQLMQTFMFDLVLVFT